MSAVIVTGAGGLIGSESVKFFHEQGHDIYGIDNDMRAYFFGAGASTQPTSQKLSQSLSRFELCRLDIRDQKGIFGLFEKLGKNTACVIHTAAQPSHDWAAKEPFTDFSINATGTLNLLEATRTYCPDATFIFTSTNKVYGDKPNFLPLVEKPTRWEIDDKHAFYQYGIDESFSVDQSKHSLFGASKLAADVLVQEYGRYFGMKTGVFRGGCLTGPAHQGAELHGFLSYLVQCAVTGKPYTIYGYGGKQVRDNIHSHDLVSAFGHFHQNPRSGAVYNIGGSRHSHCSVLEAIGLIQDLCGAELKYTLSEQARSGDHIWWVSDVRKFQYDYPLWSYRYDLRRILSEIIEVSQQS